ncbi:MAG TPA: class I SAM-dependent methyltransferase, partial [Vicinamibacterales bacterium]|nr:class I SAM-dependent methyltransferase [Vicinamibacterales bacterium]
MSQPPLPAETRYWTRTDERQRVVNAMFDRSAEHYDRACHLMSFGSGQRYRHDALERAGLRPGMRVLDVGTGTGLLAREIQRVLGPTGRIVGLDPSVNMMAAGRCRLSIALVRGHGERLPFADRSFEFVTMGYALRHVSDLDQAFEEYLRVLKPGGRLLLLEVTRPTSRLGL